MIDKLLETVNWETLFTRIIGYLPNLFTALALVLVFLIIARISKGMTAQALKKTKISPEARGLLLRFISISVYIIGGITIADQLGVNVTSLIAGAGIVGLAISFAAQDTFSNLISGIAIVIDRPFSQGDWISISDIHAKVTEIRMRTTVLTTFDNETMVVPNRQLAQERVINYTLTPRIRCRIPVGIAYKEDTHKAREVLLKTIEGDDRILADPKPAVLVKSLGSSSVNLELRFWIEQSENKFPMVWEYTEVSKRALDVADIEIPYPHLQLFIEPTDGVQMLASQRDAG